MKTFAIYAILLNLQLHLAPEVKDSVLSHETASSFSESK